LNLANLSGRGGIFTLFLLLLSILPVAVITYKIIKWDNLKPEPYANLKQVFIYGMLYAFPVAIIETILKKFFESSGVTSVLIINLINAFIIAALCEEYGKMKIVLDKVYKNAVFDEHVDGIVYSVMASMGFALVENIMYILPNQNGIFIGILRALTAVPMHAMATGIMGYYIGLSIFQKSFKMREMYVLKGLLAAIFIHGVYDFAAFTTEASFLIIPILYFAYREFKKCLELAKINDESGDTALIIKDSEDDNEIEESNNNDNKVKA